MNTSDQEQNIIISDTASQQADTSAVRIGKLIPGELSQSKKLIAPEFSVRSRAQILANTDTSSLCTRNQIADITFYDSTNFILNPLEKSNPGFPFVFYKERERIENIARIRYFQSLQEGKQLTIKTFQNDWLIFIMLFSAFLYTMIRNGLAQNNSSLSKFFLFRGIGDSASRETGSIFYLNTTLLNLVSFFNIALFAYCVASGYGFIPQGGSGFLFWLIALCIVIAAITLRHIICFLVGRASNQQELFSEYIVTIYQSYQYSAFVLLLLVVLISYSSVLPFNTLLYTGFLVFTILYAFRLIRLFLIFMNRNVSILYFLLYLCALEFLPVVVVVKFLTGLF